MKRVIESSLPVAKVARELGLLEGTLGNWVAAYRREHAGEEPQLTLDERARLRETERELREVKMENEFLKYVRRTSPSASRKREVRVYGIPHDP